MHFQYIAHNSQLTSILYIIDVPIRFQSWINLEEEMHISDSICAAMCLILNLFGNPYYSRIGENYVNLLAQFSTTFGKEL